MVLGDVDATQIDVVLLQVIVTSEGAVGPRAGVPKATPVGRATVNCNPAIEDDGPVSRKETLRITVEPG